MASINRNALTARSGTKRITIFQDMWVHTAGCVVGFAPLSSIGMLSWQGFSLKSSRDIHRYLSAGYVSSTDMQDRSCMPENLQDLANRSLPPTEIGLTRFWADFFYFYPLNDVFWLFFWYMASFDRLFFYSRIWLLQTIKYFDWLIKVCTHSKLRIN